jgi:hypothetical protein
MRLTKPRSRMLKGGRLQDHGERRKANPEQRQARVFRSLETCEMIKKRK